MEKGKLAYNGHICRILKKWFGGYYDLETIYKTELGINEIYLSVSTEDLIKQGNNL